MMGALSWEMLGALVEPVRHRAAGLHQQLQPKVPLMGFKSHWRFLNRQRD